jgi:hypothetical protein
VDGYYSPHLSASFAVEIAAASGRLNCLSELAAPGCESKADLRRDRGINPRNSAVQSCVVVLPAAVGGGVPVFLVKMPQSDDAAVSGAVTRWVLNRLISSLAVSAFSKGSLRRWRRQTLVLIGSLPN